MISVSFDEKNLRDFLEAKPNSANSLDWISGFQCILYWRL